jgi:chemotaxis protein CheD
MASLVEVVLNPGDFFFGGAEARVHTLLGSCVSVTLWHPGRLLGGMCHYMLPRRPQPAPGPWLDGRYADDAIRMFLHEVHRNGSSPEEYVAHMYGGGNQFPWQQTVPPHQRGLVPDVARDNIEAGLALLDRFGFRLAATDLGGTGPRRLAFDIATGTVALNSAADRAAAGGWPR